MTMNKPDEFKLMTPKRKRRLIAFFTIYTVLFLIIGPKFALLTVYERIAKGDFVANRVERFVSGTHQDGIVQLCFEGILLGKRTPMLYTADLSALEQKKQTFDGFGEVSFNERPIEIFGEKLRSDCSGISAPNIKLDTLPVFSFPLRMLYADENQRYLRELEVGSYVFLYRRNNEGGELVSKRFGFYSTLGTPVFYNFWLRGGLQRESSLGARDYAKAFVKDFLRWPYILILLLSGAGSH